MIGKRFIVIGATLALLAVSFGAAQAVEPQIAARLLSAHNTARTAAGVAPLSWNNDLASEAQSWANELAQRGELVHSSRSDRGLSGENLWMSAPGYYGPEDMIGAFVSERQHFRPGTFPNVSTTGNWYAVGHYTQLIWPDTREVGCALGRSSTHEVLVCRYWPAGNINGVKVP